MAGPPGRAKAPLRRALHVSLRPRWWARYAWPTLRFRHTSARSRHDAPEFCKSFPPSKRRRRRPSKRRRRECRVPEAPVAPCAKGRKHTVVDHRYAGSDPAFPARWCYGFLRALPGDRAFLPPSSPGSLLPGDLTPASGRQDHPSICWRSAKHAETRKTL